MELLEVLATVKEDDEETAVELVTSEDEVGAPRQTDYLQRIVDSLAQAGIVFTWRYDEGGVIHARHITTDHGWKFLLDRGLDIYQRYESRDAFSLAVRLPKQRAVKPIEVTLVKNG
jgi:ATP-dependent Lon protease